MKLKNIIYNIICAVVLLIIYTACDDIGVEERLIDRTKGEAVRCILVEEYSGQLCYNCPAGAAVLSELQDKFSSDSVIVVCIHANAPNFAISEPYGFATELSEDLYLSAGRPALPSIRINRQGTPIEFNAEIWRKTIDDALKIPNGIDMELQNIYIEEMDSIYVSVKINPLISDNAKLLVWLTESGIKAPQMLENKDISQDYEHKHIFRTSMTSDVLNGDEVELVRNEEFIANYMLKLNKSWNPDHLEVVAFVYNDNGVLGVTKKALK